MRLAALALVIAVASPAAASRVGVASTVPPSVPAGLVVTPTGVSPTATSLSFSSDGSTLYTATAAGQVVAIPVIGNVALGVPEVIASGLGSTLGVVERDGNVFASAMIGGRGAVVRISGDGSHKTVLGNLPVGRHNTNGLAFGPDGLLYVANGNSTDSGFGAEGGTPEEEPFSGSLLRVDPDVLNQEPEPSMVVATGWRNIYDVDFAPPGHPLEGMAAVPQNGPDGQTYGPVTRPRGEDTLSIVDVSGPVEHYGFPWCLYDREAVDWRFTQDPAQGSCSQGTVDSHVPGSVLTNVDALFGFHVSADGLAFERGGGLGCTYEGDLFVAEFGNFYGEGLAGHKIVRVSFADSGEVAAVNDFMTGIVPLDVTFNPIDGALWVADTSGIIYRVADPVAGLLPCA